MKFKKIGVIIWLCISFLCMQFNFLPSEVEARVTTREPQGLTSPEEDMPAVASTSEEKGGGKWLWTILGVALIGGLVAAAGGGGGGGGGGGDDDDDDATGTIVITGPAP